MAKFDYCQPMPITAEDSNKLDLRGRLPPPDQIISAGSSLPSLDVQKMNTTNPEFNRGSLLTKMYAFGSIVPATPRVGLRASAGLSFYGGKIQ